MEIKRPGVAGNLVKKPSGGVGKSIKLKFAKKGAHGRASPIADLNVTPMVDMLTMLVIFLLMTFSADGEVLFMTDDIILPNAYNSVALDRAPVVQVSDGMISVDGKAVMPTDEALSPQYKNTKLEPLVNRLSQMAQDYKDLHPEKEYNQVIIQSHNGIRYSVIALIMRSCAEAGFTNQSFAVTKTSKLGEDPNAPSGK